MTIKKPKLTEQAFASLFYKYSQLYFAMGFKDEKIRSLLNQPKINKREGEFGYYITHGIVELNQILYTLKINSFLDLGAGSGVLLEGLRALNSDLKLQGYEIEQLLIDQRLSNFYNTIKIVRKDILKLKRADIEGFEALYFWDPFQDVGLAGKFINNLVSIMDSTQRIVCAKGIYTAPTLERTRKLRGVINGVEFRVYKLR